MSKCVFCGEECVSHSEEVVKDIGLKLQNSKVSLLAIFYPHVFNYCTKCGMVELDLTDEEKKVLIKNKDKILGVINNPKLDKIDKNKFIRQAEVKGYACELLNDKDGALLGYKASADLLSLFIDEYVENMTSNILFRNGENARIMTKENAKDFEYAQTQKQLLDRLVVGKYDEQTIKNLGYLGLFIYLDSILNLLESDSIREDSQKKQLISYVDKMMQSIASVKIDTRFEPIEDRIENRFLLIKNANS